MLPHYKIAIVDDELSMRMQLEAMLIHQHYDTELFKSGKEFLEEIHDFQPDLIILDLMMPEMDGFDVCKKLKNDPRYQHIPIILVTVLEAKRILVKGLEAGADDFLQKPVNREELRARARSMLRIKHQYDELEATLKLREELSNMIVHDMSSPIVSVLLHTTLLNEKITDKALTPHLDKIKMAADRLDSFVNDILMLAKMEQSKLALHTADIVLNDLLKEAEAHFSIIAQSKNIDLLIDCPTTPLYVNVDCNLFYRVIANLLANALQYSPNNTNVKVLVSMTKQERVRIEVIDEGAGIPYEYRERVFDKFEVVNLKNKGIAQIGLGLTFCKMVVEAHHGRIFVEENLPTGSKFIVEL